MRALLSNALLFVCLALQPAFADPLTFETPEYWNSTGLHSLKASQAYDLGFTGKGVVVGVVDGPFAPAVGEFAGKYPYGIFGDNDDDDYHGIHVSGIIGAAKNGYGMHGVAFDASLLPFALDYSLTERDDYYFGVDAWRVIAQSYSDVKIINNSWGENFHLDSDYTSYHGNIFAQTNDDFWEELLDTKRYADLVSAAEAAGKAGKLILMASGNEGHLGPSSTAALPTLVESEGSDNSDFVYNWISVGSFDPRFPQTDPRFISVFTNLGQGAPEYTLLAPGTDIYSTISSDSHKNSSGSSMATPYASGVAALVQEAFPYMNGKQLAGVLLSTATPMNDVNSRPEFFILQRTDYEVTRNADGELQASNDDYEDTDYIVYTYQGSSVGPGPVILDEDQRRYYLKQLGCTSEQLDEALANIDASLTEAQYNALFGQGIINAYKAVQGPGYFDANRLDPDEDLSDNEFGTNERYAMYGVDTQGFDSTWSNDIDERRSDEAGQLLNLPVGLRKQGGGMLYLTGANSYQGPTVVEGGGISLGKEGSNSAASVMGGVYVRAEGLLTGDGTIAGGLESQGTLMPGVEGESGSRLTVNEAVLNTGQTLFVLGQNGLGNGLDAAGDIDLLGGLGVAGSKGAPIRPYHDYNDLAQAGGTLSVSQTDSIVVSPFLSFTPQINGDSLSLLSSTSALNSLPDVAGRTNAVAGGLEHMFQHLDGSPLQRQLDFLYNQGREDFLDTAAALRGDMQAATLTNLPLQGRLMPLIRWGALRPGKGGAAEGMPEKFSLYSGKKGPEVWIRPMAGHSGVDKKNSIGQDSTHATMQGLALGLEHSLDSLYGGALLAVGHSDIEQGHDSADIWDMRLGLYGGWQGGGLGVSALVNAGWQNYKVGRQIPVPGNNTYLKSRFDGYSAGLGLEAAYNVLHGLSESFALSPYAGFELDYIWQEGRSESGHDVFALSVRDKDVCRTSVSPGLRLETAPADWLALSASAGYRRLLSGHRPELSAAFRADSGYRFDAVAPDEGRDFVTYGLGAEAALPHNVTLSAKFFGENSDRSRSYSGFFNMRFEW